MITPLMVSAAVITPSFGDPQNIQNRSSYKHNFSENDLRLALTNIHEIKTKPGLNQVSFDAAGATAHIMVASRHGVDISSHEIFSVTVRGAHSSAWQVVPLDIEDRRTIENELDDGLYFRSVRFMTGKIDDSPETFLFISTLNGSVYNTPGPTATILVEDLQPVAQGSSEFEFLPIFQVKTQSIYDDANEALLHEPNIPLPDNYSLSQ